MSGARTVRVAIAALCVCAIACGNNDGTSGAANGSGGGSAHMLADAGRHGSGSGGERGTNDAGSAQSGGGSGTGSGGRAGGSGGSSDSGSDDIPCTAMCRSGQHCEIVQVMCIRAPCPARATCVDDTAGGSGNACGGRGLAQCAGDEFCNFSRAAACGAADAPGTCTTQPQICQDIYTPVCGCDGQTYANECMANSAGVSVASDGECESADGSTPIDCDPRKILCRRAPPECPDGQVPSVSGSCYGPCVPLESCPCDGPEQCPNPDTGTCHMSAGHCGPYV